MIAGRACFTVVALVSACHGWGHPPNDGALTTTTGSSKVERRFLSAEYDDWEPSLAVGPGEAVYVIAARNVRQPGDSSLRVKTALWSSRDGGASFGPSTFSRADQPDSVTYYGHYGGLAIDESGALHVSWSEGSGHIGNGNGGTWYARWDGK
jgi:hypothetical protein